jgi:hypothetical protein
MKSYDELMEEANNVIRNTVATYIPQLCRALRDEYDDDDDDDHSLRDSYIKVRIMRDLQGVIFQDKVFNKQGGRLLPRKGGKEIGRRHGKRIYSRPKHQSPISKLVEKLIDQEIQAWTK